MVELSAFDRHVPNGRVVHIDKGESFKPNKNYFGYILSGAIRIDFSNKNGTKKIVRVLGPKNLVGDGYFLLRRESYESFLALEKTQVCLFDRSYFDSVLCADKDAVNAIMISLAMHAESMGKQLAEALDRDPQFKIVRFLYNLLREEGRVNDRENLEYRGRLSHNDIAMYVGVNRVVVSRELEKLKTAGIIDAGQGYLEITNLAEIKRICDESI